MKQFSAIVLVFLLSLNVNFLLAQSWSWSELSSMPEGISNNAVTNGTVGGVPYVYSFAGIDSTLQFSGISLKSFRYNTQTDSWETITPLPDTLGKVAAGASTVKNKIYIIGGYHVFQNGGERSANTVHIYNPETNSYEPDGAPIPVAIDDQVQAVWRDSLIYVITGWRNTTNVPNVQIYNPTTNLWTVGTPVPNNNDYKVFGGSGTIIGDTIYYIGGARIGGSFPLTSILRKGYINPTQPEQITWEAISDPLAIRYRSGAFVFQDRPYWLGGATTSYNFDALAYAGGQIVDPENDLLTIIGDTIVRDTSIISAIMDLRGVAQVGLDKFIVAGGILQNGMVSNKTFLLEYNHPVGLDRPKINAEVTVYPSPTAGQVQVKVKEGAIISVEIFSELGERVLLKEKVNSKAIQLNLDNLTNGYYLIRTQTSGGLINKRIQLIR